MLFIFSQHLILKGLHWSLSITVPSVESHMQTNMLILNFFPNVCWMYEKKTPLFSSHTAVWVGILWIRVVLKSMLGYFCTPCLLLFSQGKGRSLRRRHFPGYCYSVLSQYYSECHTILVTSKRNALPCFMSWINFILPVCHLCRTFSAGLTLYHSVWHDLKRAMFHILMQIAKIISDPHHCLG